MIYRISPIPIAEFWYINIQILVDAGFSGGFKQMPE